MSCGVAVGAFDGAYVYVCALVCAYVCVSLSVCACRVCHELCARTKPHSHTVD